MNDLHHDSSGDLYGLNQNKNLSCDLHEEYGPELYRILWMITFVFAKAHY